MNLDYRAWQVQVGLSLLFALVLARLAKAKGRHPLGAALLLLTFANGWPLVWAAIGRGIATAFALNETARATMERVFGWGGVMFGVATSFAIVGCLRPRPVRRSDVTHVGQS